MPQDEAKESAVLPFWRLSARERARRIAARVPNCSDVDKQAILNLEGIESAHTSAAAALRDARVPGRKPAWVKAYALANRFANLGDGGVELLKNEILSNIDIGTDEGRRLAFEGAYRLGSRGRRAGGRDKSGTATTSSLLRRERRARAKLLRPEPTLEDKIAAIFRRDSAPRLGMQVPWIEREERSLAHAFVRAVEVGDSFQAIDAAYRLGAKSRRAGGRINVN